MWAKVLLMVCCAVVGVHTSSNCPDIKNVSCACDIPFTYRCTGTDPSVLDKITASLQNLPPSQAIVRLDCTIQKLVHINEPILKGVSLHGLVISSGTLMSVTENAFDEIKTPLETLGFPNNQLAYVPILAISKLTLLRILDLSHNRLRSVGRHSFQGLFTLRFLDLSWNRLSNISHNAFNDMTHLERLRLQSNNLDGDVLARLEGLPNLLEMDVSNNRLAGSLKPSSFPDLPKLTALNVAYNQISSVVKGALKGLVSLQSLNAEHNLIDVLEDFAFNSTPALRSLNLAHNRIIAFSESSFSGLSNLTTLDLSKNFLRVLSNDLFAPLLNLIELRVDENDITMISTESLNSAKSLRVLSLSKNPLNCDCNLLGFAEWLNRTTLEQQKKMDAVCAIPPSLENALVYELTREQLVCGQDDSMSNYGTLPLSSTKVMLQGFDYNGTHVSLLWLVDTDVPYHCGQLFVYEELGAHEVLLKTESLGCSSASVENPHFLSVAHDVSRMEKGHKYRYCITMEEFRKPKSESSNLLASGCSEIMALKEVYPPRIAVLQAVNPSLAVLEITAESWPRSAICSGRIIAYADSQPVQQIPFHCNNSKYNLTVMPFHSHYNVCVLLSDDRPKCTTVYAQHILPHPYTPLVILLLLLSVMIFVLVSVAFCRYCTSRGRTFKLGEQYSLAKNHDENRTTRYRKLQATTIV